MLKLHFEPHPELFNVKLMPVYTKSLTDLLGLVEAKPFFLPQSILHFTFQLKY
jgi:hypothetical protein